MEHETSARPASPPESGPETSPAPELSIRLQAVNQIAARFYRALFAGASGAGIREGVQKFGVTAAVAERFGLGYAPGTGDGLVRRLRWEGVPLSTAAQLDLVGRGGRGTWGPYDRLQDCLVLPVPSARTPLGCAGFPLDGGAPVLVRGTRDGAHLFGLYEAEESMLTHEIALLVASPLDVLLLHSHDVTEAVTPLGEGLTALQADTLAQGIGRGHVVLIDDGERTHALRDSALRVLGPRLGRVVTLPAGQGLARFLRTDGAGALLELIDEAGTGRDERRRRRSGRGTARSARWGCRGPPRRGWAGRAPPRDVRGGRGDEVVRVELLGLAGFVEAARVGARVHADGSLSAAPYTARAARGKQRRPDRRTRPRRRNRAPRRPIPRA